MLAYIRNNALYCVINTVHYTVAKAQKTTRGYRWFSPLRGNCSRKMDFVNPDDALQAAAKALKMKIVVF